MEKFKDHIIVSLSMSSPSSNSNSDIHAYDYEIPLDDMDTEYPESAEMGKVLMGMDFPADKNKIIQFVIKQQDVSKECRIASKEVISLLNEIEDKQYENAFEVTKAAGLVRYLI